MQCSTAAALLVACAALAPAAPAAAKDKTEKHPALGLVLSRPLDYEPLPVRASERFAALAYRERITPVEREAGATPAALEVFLVPRRAAEGEAVVDGESFLRHELRPAEVEELHPGRERYGHAPRRWRAVLAGGAGAVAAYVHAWEGEERTVVLVGRCAPGRYAEERRRWERVAASVRMVAPGDVDAERGKLERYYGQRRFRCADYRIDVRLSMVGGWEAHDTEHYIVLSHDVDTAFVRELCSAVESMRRELARRCPPDRDLEGVSTIRICRDAEEFAAYGGADGTVGYWSPGEGELVLFDASAASGPGFDGRHYTLAVLYHEAFHQYVYSCADRLAPHSWYDEGLAEYFAGARVEAGRLRGFEANRYRLAAAQAALRDGRTYPWETVVGLTQEQFYADPEVLYAQAWSMVHFLEESPDARRRWSSILPTYFRTLRSAWASERRRLAGTSVEEVEEARRRAREKAREAAFRGVEWEEIEECWRGWVMGLRASGG